MKINVERYLDQFKRIDNIKKYINVGIYIYRSGLSCFSTFHAEANESSLVVQMYTFT